MAVKQASQPITSSLRLLERRYARLARLPGEQGLHFQPLSDMGPAPLQRPRWLAQAGAKQQTGPPPTADLRVTASSSSLEAPAPLPAPTCTPRGNPLPASIHASLTAEQLGSGRVLVVGDVHGCLEELRELLAAADFRQGLDTLVLVGDLVNKGPHSAEVVAEARRLGAYAVRGNHDDSALAAYRALQRGEAAEIDAVYRWVGGLAAEDAAWLAELPFTLSLPSRRVLVSHAGLLPGVPLPQQALDDMYTMRDVMPAKLLSAAALSGKVVSPGGLVASAQPQNGGQAWCNAWEGPEHLFFGHDALRQLQRRPFATGLDTGCCYGFKLTACILPPPPPKKLLSRVLSHLKPGAKAPMAPVPLPVEGGKGGARGVTLEALGAQLISVESKHTYEDVVRY